MSYIRDIEKKIVKRLYPYPSKTKKSLDLKLINNINNDCNEYFNSQLNNFNRNNNDNEKALSDRIHYNNDDRDNDYFRFKKINNEFTDDFKGYKRELSTNNFNKTFFKEDFNTEKNLTSTINNNIKIKGKNNINNCTFKNANNKNNFINNKKINNLSAYNDCPKNIEYLFKKRLEKKNKKSRNTRGSNSCDSINSHGINYSRSCRNVRNINWSALLLEKEKYNNEKGRNRFLFPSYIKSVEDGEHKIFDPFLRTTNDSKTTTIKLRLKQFENDKRKMKKLNVKVN
jgi:hypothetical protein